MNTTHMLLILFCAIGGGVVSAILVSVIIHITSQPSKKITSRNITKQERLVINNDREKWLSKYKKIENVLLCCSVILGVNACIWTIAFCLTIKMWMAIVAFVIAVISLCSAFSWRYVLIHKSCSVEYNRFGIIVQSTQANKFKNIYTWQDLASIIVGTDEITILCKNGDSHQLKYLTMNESFIHMANANGVVVENDFLRL